MPVAPEGAFPAADRDARRGVEAGSDAGASEGFESLGASVMAWPYFVMVYGCQRAP